MFEDGCILEKPQYMLIFKISFLLIPIPIIAFYNGYTDCSLIAGTIFLTSVNYWRKPICSWRREADMFAVKYGAIYHIIRAYQSEYMVMYYILLLFAVFCYPISYYLYNEKKYWASTYIHCLLHLLANFTNGLLYVGCIVPIEKNLILVQTNYLLGIEPSFSNNVMILVTCSFCSVVCGEVTSRRTSRCL